MRYRDFLNLRATERSSLDLTGPLPSSMLSQLAGVVEALAVHSRTPRTLAVISARPGEGTSTCVVNLARYLTASRHAKVLMVDANPHRPRLHALTGLDAAGGLSELLEGAIGFETAAKATPLANLFLLASGVRTPFSTNGLLHPAAMREQVLARATGYDYVLIDCPAVNANEDAARTAALCDGVILVVDGRTQRQSAQAAKALLLRANCNLLGVFMNKRRFYIPQFLYDRL